MIRSYAAKASNAKTSRHQGPQSGLMAGTLAAKPQPLEEADPLACVPCQRVDTSSASAHACLLDRVMTSQQSGAEQILLRLQKQHGNRYVQRVMARAKRAHVVQQGTHPAAPLSRLSVGEPGDRFEREADRVAEAMAGKEGSRLPATHSVRRAEEDDSPSVQLFRPEATARRHPSISAVSAPLVQRVATFNTGPVYTWNLASQAAAGGSYGQTLV